MQVWAECDYHRCNAEWNLPRLHGDYSLISHPFHLNSEILVHLHLNQNSRNLAAQKTSKHCNMSNSIRSEQDAGNAGFGRVWHHRGLHPDHRTISGKLGRSVKKCDYFFFFFFSFTLSLTFMLALSLKRWWSNFKALQAVLCRKM